MSCEFCHHDNPHDYRCPNYEPKIHGYCPQCYTPLLDTSTYYVDNDGNRFCSEECAIQNHGIIEIEWEDEDE